METASATRQRRGLLAALVAQAVLSVATLASYFLDDGLALAVLRTLTTPLAGLTAGVLLMVVLRHREKV